MFLCWCSSRLRSGSCPDQQHSIYYNNAVAHSATKKKTPKEVESLGPSAYMESLEPHDGNGNSEFMASRKQRENHQAWSDSTVRALRLPSAALTDRPKVAPLCQNLFVCQYRRSPFHNFSQGQLDLAALTGKMIEDIIGRHQHPRSQNRAHREHTHTLLPG